MDIAVTPDMYAPGVDINGDYVDSIPNFSHGYMCPCNVRKHKVYETKSKFTVHCKSKCHQKWLQSLNHNKSNYYVELIKMKELVENQRKIIAQLEESISKKIMTIDYLTEEVLKMKRERQCSHESINLIDLD